MKYLQHISIDEIYKNDNHFQCVNFIVQDHAETKAQLEKVKKDLAETKKESHKRKKLLMAQQQLIHAGSGSYNKVKGEQLWK